MLLKSIALSVEGVVLEDEGESPTVLLRDSSGEYLMPVPVGAFEASAIIIEIEGIKPPRALTHDLIAELALRHRFRMIEFLLYGRTDEGFLGRIAYRKGLRSWTMEVRPSDGIALALRLGAPIRADRDLFDAAAVPACAEAPFRADSGSVLYWDAKTCRDDA